jgi:hypothetical protein
VNRIGEVADGLASKVKWFALIGLAASAGLAIKLYSAESALWWNVIKCGVVSLPALIWLFVWFVLEQLREGPDKLAELSQGGADELYQQLKTSVSEPSGLRGLYSTVKALRQADGVGAIFDTIGGIGLMVNPLFALLALIAMLLLILMMLIAPLVWLF